MPADISKNTLDQETDVRFWAQTGFKPGQKLDPNNSTDKAYLPLWKDIFRKVQREADAGTLVTTYDHPVVARLLSDATIANKAAAAHLDAAVASTDPATAQENVAAATVATQISAQKAREAAANQPPVVSPARIQEAGKEAIKSPPPPSAPSGDHIAHGHAHAHAYGHHRAAQAAQAAQATQTGPSLEALYQETNTRFWQQTHYKPGQKLDRANPQDREKAKIWMALFRQVQHEAAAGTLVFTSPEAAQAPPQMPRPPMAQPPLLRPPMIQPSMPSMQRPPMVQPSYPQPYQPYPQPYQPSPPYLQPYQPYAQMPPMVQPSPYQPYAQMPPMAQPSPQMPQPPNEHERGSRPRHGRGHHPKMSPSGPQPGGPTPQTDVTAPQGGPSAPPSGDTSPGGGFAPSEGTPSDSMPGTPPSPDTQPHEATSVGTYLAIGLAIVAGGGLLYYATSRKSPGRPPKVLLATPARSTSLSAFPRP